MTRRNILATSITIFSILFLLAVACEAPDIRLSVHESAKKAVDDNEFHDVVVRTSGRSVALHGVIPDQHSQDRLIEVVESVRGVRGIQPRVIVSSSRALELRVDGKRLELAGVVPEYRSHDFLVSYARQVFGGRNVIDNTAIVEQDVELSWPNTVRMLIDEAAESGDVRYKVSDGIISVYQENRSDEEQQILLDRINGKMDDSFTVRSVTDAASAAEMECLRRINTLASGQIQFASGTARLSDAAAATLTDIARAMAACPRHHFLIEGHTDPSGPEAANIRLSGDRAAAVLRALVDKGVAARRLKSNGLGSVDPVASNETPEGKARNRRIEFKPVR